MRYTISQVKRENRQAGGEWFAPETMRFFGTKLYPEAVSENRTHVYFVTSEQYSETTDRKFTVRQFDKATKRIDTVSQWMGYKALEVAAEFALIFAKGNIA